VELAVLRRRGPGLVPVVPRLHALREGHLLPGRVAAAAPARRHRAQRRVALDRRPRGRLRRGADGALGEAGGQAPGVDAVARSVHGLLLRPPQAAPGGVVRDGTDPQRGSHPASGRSRRNSLPDTTWSTLATNSVERAG